MLEKDGKKKLEFMELVEGSPMMNILKMITGKMYAMKHLELPQ